jgi:deoxyribodipyrimidine photo-lyase
MPTCNVKVISQFNFKNYGAGFIAMRRVIHWFRRDLRVTDNTALWHACDQADEVIPVYILSTWKKRHPWTGPNRQEFLCGCLESLSKNLEAIGGCLILRAGDPVQELGNFVNVRRRCKWKTGQGRASAPQTAETLDL